MGVDAKEAVAAVKGFLRAALELGDGEAAKGFLSKESLATTTFELPAELKGAKYEVGLPEETAEGLFVPVTLTDGATGMSQTLPFAPVLEEGAWKLDMGRMMERLMGGAMQQMVEQVGSAMGAAMEGVGAAIGGAMEMAFGGSGGGTEGAPAGETGAEDLEKLKKRVEEINSELSDRNNVEVRVEMDAGSLLRGEGKEAVNAGPVRKIMEDVLRNFVYAVTEANRAIPLEGRVKVIRLEGVRESRERVVLSEGARIIYRLSVKEAGGEGGFYDGQELSTILTGVAAGMAETAPPGEVQGKASYRPSGEGAKIVRDYKEFVLPGVTKRIAEMVGHDVDLQVEWESFEGTEEYARALWLWGFNRVCGAIGLLVTAEEVRAAIAEAVESVRILSIPQKEMKAIEMNGKEMLVYISPDDGEAGAFYEGEIAEKLSGRLKLRTRPMIAELERYAKSWEKNLEELFGIRIQYAFDWDGFTCNEDEGKNAFALTRLRENGIEWMAQVLASLAEKNPNFKQQVPLRVRWIYLEFAPRAEMKGVRGEQTTLALKLFLHEGYSGYLTLKELEKALPKIVADMPDIAGEASPQPEEGEMEGEEKEAETEVPEGVDPNDRAPQPYQPEPVEENVPAEVRKQFEQVLPVYAQQCAMILGKAVTFGIEWESLTGGVEAMGMLLNAGLTPVIGGLAILLSDAKRKQQAQEAISRVVLRQTMAGSEHGFTLKDGTLTYAVMVSPAMPTMDPQLAATLLGTVLDTQTRARRVGAKTRKAAKPAKKKAKPPAKTPAKGDKKKPKKKK